jgi:heat shock protein HslJ
MGRTLALLIVAAVLVSACSTGGSGSDDDATTSPSPTPATLIDTSWRLTQVGDDVAAVPDAIKATLSFSGADAERADIASGSTGCNRFSGPYTLGAGDALSFGALAATQRACSPAINAVEGAYLTALDTTDAYTLDGDTLTLLAGGREVAVLTRQTSPSLVGPTWQATAINNGKEAVVSVVSGTRPTAAFDDDGRITGDTGCNTFNGSYEIDGEGAIGIGPLASTKKACADEQASAQEAAYLAALQQATVYRFVDGTLELRNDDGALQVSFTQD